MRLKDLIVEYHNEKKEWPESPNSLLDFCQYKYNKGEIPATAYRNLFFQLHKEGATSAH
ncbi:hypothetical protein GWK91_01205 [Virgibacillus sp. MSP4-1]|uniref:YppF family protein n=1 Tax=Virgibacillus sp. MSP4-1 TaxID=2700081 RepID=UPI0003A203F7|nr:YppF family protein [Virgibacillus sp. MSP4-1]QHS21652.1 hypothetical protein GWK91_01205 [Virgibacillus sp. MSP4-1]